MNLKQKAVENVKSYLDKRVEKNNHKLLDYRDREKVYGLRYEDKKDVIHAENEFIDNLLRGDAATQFNDDRLEKLQSKVNRLLGEYSSKEKALNVLDEIQDAIEDTYYYRIDNIGHGTYALGKGVQVYQMPQDEDVEV